MKRSGVFKSYFTLLLLLACDNHGVAPGSQVIEETKFAARLGIDLSSMEVLRHGIYFQDKIVGTGFEVGAVSCDYNVRIDFDLWLSDGRFVTSEQGFSFGTGLVSVLPGIETGVWGMRVGGERRIILPPAQGYAQHPPPGSWIPTGAILIYDLVLTSASLRCG